MNPTTVPLAFNRLDALLAGMGTARIGVLGDFCVDSYYHIDVTASEPSLETGISTRPVQSQRHTLGVAGNVLANLHALGVRQLSAFAVIGPDMQGRELQRLLDEHGVNRAGVITQPAGWQTNSYLKPIVEGQECHRYDFGIFNRLAAETAGALLQAITAALPLLDVLVINQQFKSGIYTDAEFRAGLHAALAARPRLIVLSDCRDHADAATTVMHKLNDLEATRLCGGTYQPRDHIPREKVLAAADELYARWRTPVFITRGERGCLAVDQNGVHEVPGLHLIGPTDSVGAGDSMVAGIAACLAQGATPAEAAALGNLAAGVTVQKLHTTGTASPDEVRAIGESPDQVFRPELAEDMRMAVYAPDTEIEIAEPLPAEFSPGHAIFDHDGTISTLREGWEAVMAPMMMKAILGPAHATAERDVVERVEAQVDDFIDKTTGIQTLRQMHGLAGMVRAAGFVPAAEILDAAGYKRIYNDALMQLVNDRLARLQRGELGVGDFTLKNAVPLLERLAAAKVKLYLASGTDEQDVIREAEALGYAPLFEGRIYGASHDMTHDAKRMVLDRILREIGPGNSARIVTFGDGPVEIRETRKRGGLAVGVASDEVRRFGLNGEKRARLIRAGANLVTADYAQLPALLNLLHLGEA
jgi:bifunctional ADP-heptose synthase (sugar kinase/adenylyltransferase)/phosphoglycolate phosphatase-like HAD superfamily hydrolase